VVRQLSGFDCSGETTPNMIAFTNRTQATKINFNFVLLSTCFKLYISKSIFIMFIGLMDFKVELWGLLDLG